PYAITTQNALSSALNLIRGLGAGSTAGDVTAAAESLATVESDFSLLSAGADAWELESFGPRGSQIFTQVQTQQSALRGAVKTIGSTLSQLRGCVSRPGACQNAYQTIAGVLLGGSIGGPLAFIYNYDGTATSPTLASNAPSAPTATPTGSDPEEWLISTCPGTSLKEFQAFIKALPDQGSGRQILFPAIDDQGYVTKMTREEAEIVNNDPIVDFIMSNQPFKIIPNFLNSTATDSLHQRDDNGLVIVDDRRDVKRYQQMLCFPPGKPITELPAPDDYFYAHERSDGEGTFVYIFDEGFRFSHEQFSGQRTESILMPTIDNNGNPRANTMSDDSQYPGHGTPMAAIVNGRTHGVAKKATVVGVKVGGGNQVASPSELYEGWKFAVNDVVFKGRTRKTVFVHAYSHLFSSRSPLANGHVELYHKPPYNIPRSRDPDLWPSILAKAWLYGIVTVGATGNIQPNAPDLNQGAQNPQRFATEDNAWITVGSLDAQGQKMWYNVPTGPGPLGYDQALVGTNTIYAHADDLSLATKLGDNGYALRRTGSSFAAPQIAALAAYYLGLPNTRLPERVLDIPMAVKRHLVGLARGSTDDAPGLAYNGVWDGVCGAIRKRQVKEKREALRALRKLKGLEPVDVFASF
ncbi:MAG: hypothetical protein Q9193_006671, partial [Seirophora villosa]